jgi:hypothetical protein
MTKRQRVMAALRGEAVDREALWLHNRCFDWDALKPQSRAQCSINPDTPEPLLASVGDAVGAGG